MELPPSFINIVKFNYFPRVCPDGAAVGCSVEPNIIIPKGEENIFPLPCKFSERDGGCKRTKRTTKKSYCVLKQTFKLPFRRTIKRKLTFPPALIPLAAQSSEEGFN